MPPNSTDLTNQNLRFPRPLYPPLLPTTPPSRHPAWQGPTMIVLTLMGWTSIPLFLKHFTHLIDGWTANGWRYGFSALMWLPVLIWAALKHKTPPNLWRAALPASLFNIGAQICFGLAPYYIDPGLMTFSLRVQIVFVTIGAVLLFPAERKTIRSWGFLTGIILVLSGTIAVLLLKPGGLGKGSATGIMLALGSGFLYAGYALCVRKHMQGLNALIAFAAVSQYTGVALLACMFAFGKDHGAVVFTMEPKQIVLLLLSAIIGIGIGHTLYYASINRLGLAVSAGVVQLQPITVSIGSMLIFNEQLSTIQWIFGIIAVCGAGLILWTQGRKKT